MNDSEGLPRRLRDLDEETIEWLDRLTTEERQALIWAGHLPSEKRERLDKFLALSKEHFEAGFKIVELWTKVRWLAWLFTKVVFGTAALLLAVSQILASMGIQLGGKQ